MRILLIGNGNTRHAALRHNGFDTRVFNGLVRNNHFVYFFSDRDEAKALSPFGIRSMGQKKANDKLLDVTRNFEPEAIILTHCELITAETLRAVKKILPATRIAYMNVDAIFAPQNTQNLRERRGIADAVFITTGGAALQEFSSPDYPFYFVPNITDRSIDIGWAFADDALDYDLVCMMHNGPGDDASRLHLANGVKAALPALRTCYTGFNNVPSVRGIHYVRQMSKAAMGLNLSRAMIDGVQSTTATRYLYSSDRIAHLLGNGVLTLVPDQFGLQDLYSANEVVFFHDLPDLIDKVRFYKDNIVERQRIATNGWRKAHEEFNEEITMRYVVERLFDHPLSRDYAWPVEAWR